MRAETRTVGAATAALLASSATLVCCALPAVLVAVGAGAALVGLISAFPQLIWLSEHKGLVFGVAGAFLVGAGLLLWRAGSLPCPVDPQLARQCQKLRALSKSLYLVAVFVFGIGAVFAFGLPLSGDV